MIADPLGAAVLHLRGGGLVGYPTETVWGLGADARSASGLRALRAWKGREADHPISVLLSGLEALARCGLRVDPRVELLAKRFWPGPLTLVLPATGGFAPGVARDDGAVGVRCSAHPLAAALARRLEAEGVGPATATSLNPSGARPARTREEAAVLCGRVHGGRDAPRLLDVAGAEAGGERESTVLDLSGDAPRVLRWGAVPPSELEPALAELRVDGAGAGPGGVGGP